MAGVSIFWNTGRVPGEEQEVGDGVDATGWIVGSI